jgi:enoyl-CoA hydratase/carnithine racemase
VIDLERDGAVFLLRMRAGENMISRPFVAAFSDALDEVIASTDDVALVTTGEDRFYNTGLDLAGLAGAGADVAQALLNELHSLLARLLTLPMPTVAAINGHAFAAGAMLAMAHDYRVMRTDRGYWCLPEVDLRTGRPLTAGMYAVLKAKMAPQVLGEALITGKRYTANEALALGIVQDAEPEDAVVSRAVSHARGLAAKDRVTLAAIKQGLYAHEVQVLSEPVPPELV